MKLYNTLTRTVEPVKPLRAPQVTVYTCGPTVYDYAHIGHWFNYVRMDTLIRALKLDGLEPKWVMNITDVGHLVSDADEGEDKLEKGARREGKTAWEVAEFYTQDFLKDMHLLNILEPDHIVKATDHIAEQIALIQKLESKGYTYVIDDGVYYDTSKFEGYAAFARLDLDDLQAGARVAFNEQKRNSSDFALWKFSPKDHKRDMEWDSPWGKGFPGWHIECSAMSMKYLGDTIDIHTGGIDHIPVHHTNEIAQSEAATGKRFANVWMHSNHVMVNGEKISKSLGNGIRLQEIVEQGISPEAVRLHVLESHYRSHAKFSLESLRASQASLKNIRNDFSWIYQPAVVPVSKSEERSRELVEQFASYKQLIKAAIINDLATPEAMRLLHECAGRFATTPASMDDAPIVDDFAAFIQDALGIHITDRDELKDELKQLIAEREQARANKDWAKSDELRDKLAADGIGVRDTPSGAIWYRL
ncbi:MAG TPA: cysteine--tRNA ligase [Candidatus Saccharimonadales bacterium]|nr:cysteine--tRNA ligase [Candidatus Saccharimonadales bacterium]